MSFYKFHGSLSVLIPNKVMFCWYKLVTVSASIQGYNVALAVVLNCEHFFSICDISLNNRHITNPTY